MNNDDPNMIRLLFQNGADPFAEDKNVFLMNSKLDRLI